MDKSQANPIREMILVARPRHWAKNSVVLLPVLFAMKIADPSAWFAAGLTLVAFCLASSFAYILNDIRDIESDRRHPIKNTRPLAAGRLGIGTALVEAVGLLCAALVLSSAIRPMLLVIVGLYALLQTAYSLALKHRVLLDVIAIALGFVLRTVGGAVAIGVAISPWLFICMFTLCLFMGFCKRYNELALFDDPRQAGSLRTTLLSYTPPLLTHLITVSAGIAVVGFLLYGLSDSTIEHFGTDYFVYTLPVMVYGVFRFAMLSMQGTYTDPTELFFRDRPFQATVVLWLAMAVAIIGWGKELQGWFQTFIF
ncbi:MAG: decaprenyl-phosphate phosphoribosyltransferase [Phycisphaerae bacterium]|nr:decaprenyl-phosphate phosphoribosyltransferase [Phycisphaerae bacterium]